VQVNGIEDVDVWTTALAGDVEAWNRLEQMLIDRGVGAWCPTLVTADRGKYDGAMRFIASRDSGSDRPLNLGVHLEGPFLGAAIGAHRRDLVCDTDPTFFDHLPVAPALVTMGAESTGAAEAIEELVRRGVVVSIGHSRPSRREFDRAVECGARMVTHLHNAMSAMAHRDPGLATWALTDDRVVAGLIADGVHVHPDIVGLSFRCKPDGIALVSDSVAWRDGRAGPVRLSIVDGAPRLADGTLAGSVTTMSQSLRVCRDAGVPVEVAIRAATSTPARVLGCHDVGNIRQGARADFVELNADLDVIAVWIGGVRRR
jgi:N-acetylglucosamine-6-phosphate deacetylase